MKMERSHLSYTSRNYNLWEAAQNNSLTGTDIFVPVRLFLYIVLHIHIAGNGSKISIFVFGYLWYIVIRSLFTKNNFGGE